jgi:hypothetical protein
VKILAFEIHLNQTAANFRLIQISRDETRYKKVRFAAPKICHFGSGFFCISANFDFSFEVKMFGRFILNLLRIARISVKLSE